MAKKPLKHMKAIRISDEQLKRLAEIGEEMDRPASWLIRRAIDEFIKRAKPSKKSR
jgi:predicted transcriptional regulator